MNPLIQTLLRYNKPLVIKQNNFSIVNIKLVIFIMVERRKGIRPIT